MRTRLIACTAVSAAIGVSAVVVSAGGPGSAATPPTTTKAEAPSAAASPGESEGSTEFERQLAELAFAEYLVGQLGLDADTIACTEPAATDERSTITCFATVDDTGVVVATTSGSSGTGLFAFELDGQYGTTVPPASEPPASDPEPTAPLSDADAAVYAYGDQINAGSDEFIAQYLTDPRVASIQTYHFDAPTLTLTLDMTLANNVPFTPQNVAWTNTKALAELHWAIDQPFRNPAATLKPSLTVIVNGRTFVSDSVLIVEVANEAISMDDWITIASR